jgi:hypothetical protein
MVFESVMSFLKGQILPSGYVDGMRTISAIDPFRLTRDKLFYFVSHFQFVSPLSDFSKRPQEGQKPRLFGVTFGLPLFFLEMNMVNNQICSHLNTIFHAARGVKAPKV